MTFNRDLPLKDMMRPVPADPGAVEGDSFRLNIDMLIKIVLRRLWLLAIVVGAVLMLAIYGLSKTTPQYVAGAELLLGEPASGAPLGDILAERVLNSQAVERELAILKSNRLLAQVVLALELDKDPEFNAALRPETPAEKFVRELKGTIKSFITPPPEPGPAPSAQVEAAAGAEQDRLQGLGGTIASLKGRLRIRQLGDSYLVRVTMVSANRKKAAAIANTVVDQYIAQIVEDRRIQAERFASWLDRRLTTIEKEVEAAENDVLEFRASVITGSDSAERLNQQMRELTTKLISARSELLATEARYTKLQQIHDDQGPLAAADVLDAPVIANYRATIAELKREEADVIRRFGENASQLITLRQSIDSLNKDIAREVVRVLAEIGNSAEISRAVVDSLENSLTNIERLTVERAREQIELRQLDRVAEASRLVYERFFDSYRKQQEVQNFEDTNAAVISYASPPFAPSTPKVLLTLVLATAAGGMLGLGIIVLLELRRRTVKTADDVPSQLGLSVFGKFPKVQTQRGARHLPAVLNPRMLPKLTQGAVNLRSYVQLLRDEPIKTVLVTSSLQKEGKTSTAAMLAWAAARAGASCVLVDGDLRNPSFIGGTEDDAPTLADVLENRASVADALRFEPSMSCYVLPARRAFEDPSNLFDSARVSKLLETLRNRFDFVVIDSPPVLGVSDALAFGRHVDLVLFAVRSGSTSISDITRALRLLQVMRVSEIGAVLTFSAPDNEGRGYYDAI